MINIKTIYFLERLQKSKVDNSLSKAIMVGLSLNEQLVNTEIPEEYKWQEQAEQKRLLYVAMTRARGVLKRFFLIITDSMI